MTIAEPSVSKSVSGPSVSVTRVVIASSVPFAVRVRHDLRQVAHVERVIHVGIHVAGRTRIEVSARRGEVGFTLADRVQVHAVGDRASAPWRSGEFPPTKQFHFFVR